MPDTPHLFDPETHSEPLEGLWDDPLHYGPQVAGSGALEGFWDDYDHHSEDNPLWEPPWTGDEYREWAADLYEVPELPSD